MKFAKEIEEDLVPEWRAKYFDYKQGKKKVKAVTRAVKAAQRTPPSGRLRPTPPARSGTSDSAKTPFLGAANGYGSFWTSKWSHTQRPGSSDEDEEEADENGDLPHVQPYQENNVPTLNLPQPAQTKPQPVPINRQNGNGGQNDSRWMRYGSIVGTPPSPMRSGGASLRLPGPAMDPDAQGTGTIRRNEHGDVSNSLPRLRPSRRSAPAINPADGSAFEAGKTRRPFRHVSFTGTPRRSKSATNASTPHERPLLRRIFSPKPASHTAAQSDDDMPLEALKAIDIKQAEFFDFLDQELNKIETFYDSKEEEATKRLDTLRAQLHIMRDHRLEEIVQAQRRKEARAYKGNDALEGVDEFNHSSGHIMANPEHVKDLPNALDMLYHPIKAAKQIQFRPHPHHNNNLATPPSSAIDHNKDYTRRPEKPEVPYLTAKRKLKAALQEYYRGLELLKAYALLNRTAFRKINKKYDKAVHARPTMRYMYERVNNAHFVKSSILDGHITAVEDLYARYFEKGNHKIAVNKLRKKNSRIGHYTGSVFRNGVFAAAGLVFGIEGLVYGAELLFDSDPLVTVYTSYLLQLYAGYFLLLYLFLLFCFDCAVFEHARVNFRFCFEYDPRTTLSWQQMAELPCLFLFLLGITLWLNFSRIGGETMYIYWPVILMGLTTLIIFAPVPIFYHHSRKWLAYSLWRLLFAGAYPVEFRDFFSGDMFCSQTYAMGNIELFFCLYAHHWTNPPQCNSSSSRLLGFFTCLPGVWRLLQCLRRYYDTRNVFPHLVNGGKYTATILAGMSLSMYRINKTEGMRGFFIAVSIVNSIYTSIWDLLMDWSLLDPNAPYPYLRPVLTYKNPYVYYAAMILDPILRFSWIFYAIYYHNLQHSAIISFIVAFAEVTRRGIWVIFRVENEHNTNVGRFRASRDVPLPYKTKTEDPEDAGGEEHSAEDDEQQAQADANGLSAAPNTPALSSRTTGRQAAQTPATASAGISTGTDLEAARSPAVASLRRRQGDPNSNESPDTLSIRERFGRILRGAHAQDFERRRKSEEDEIRAANGDEEDDEDADDAEEHAQDLETGGHGMDQEDTAEVGRRLRTPVARPESRGNGDRGEAVRSRWRDIASGVVDFRRSRQSVEALTAGDAMRRGSDAVVEVDEDEDEGNGHGDERDGEEEYDEIEDRRDILGAKVLTEHATGVMRNRSDEDEK